MSEVTLKPCECGAPARRVVLDHARHTAYAVECTVCGYETRTDEAGTPDEADETWNTRHQPEPDHAD